MAPKKPASSKPSAKRGAGSRQIPTQKGKEGVSRSPGTKTAARSAQRGAKRAPKSGTADLNNKVKPVKKLPSKALAVTRVAINRAPVLTLWAAVVAEGLGHTEASALTFGKAVAQLAAIGKGRGLGLMGPPQSGKSGGDRNGLPGKQRIVPLCGMNIAVVKTPQGLRAQAQGTPLDPYKVSLYLTKAFGESLPAVHEAFRELASSLSKSELRDSAFSVYEKIRPSVDKGVAGWGQKGTLDLRRVLNMARGK
mmetsp:Transcript_4553/g.10723  ORF Transcript_4553/g.10723 Transcript_4553/m.10723 type:complete len:251 (-) Transcript_4553:94-846(-)